jgi:cytochrome c oxidase subunit 2
VDKPGTYYGQCSEICGTGHAYMPIAVRAVSKAEFAAWVQEKGGKMPVADVPAAKPAQSAAADAPVAVPASGQ